MVLVELSGKTREIKFDFNAICAIEEKTGRSTKQLFDIDVSSFNSIRMLLWAGLRHKMPGITPDMAGNFIQDWMKSNRLEDLSGKIAQALTESDVFGKADENEAEEDDETEGE